MPRFVVGSLRLERWYTAPDIPWLAEGDVLADALRDLRPKDGTHSVYEVPQPEDQALIKRIVVAIAAGQENPRDVGYFLFERADVDALGIPINNAVSGGTGDAQVNALHRDLEHLSAQSPAVVARIMANGEQGEVLAKELRGIVKTEVAADRLDKSKVSAGLRKELNLG